MAPVQVEQTKQVSVPKAEKTRNSWSPPCRTSVRVEKHSGGATSGSLISSPVVFKSASPSPTQTITSPDRFALPLITTIVKELDPTRVTTVVEQTAPAAMPAGSEIIGPAP